MTKNIHLDCSVFIKLYSQIDSYLDPLVTGSARLDPAPWPGFPYARKVRLKASFTDPGNLEPKWLRHEHRNPDHRFFPTRLRTSPMICPTLCSAFRLSSVLSNSLLNFFTSEKRDKDPTNAERRTNANYSCHIHTIFPPTFSDIMWLTIFKSLFCSARENEDRSCTKQSSTKIESWD